MLYNIFIEGVPGSGKSTLLSALESRLNGYSAYREGDVCPVELAWCAFMTEDEFDSGLAAFPELSERIRALAVREGADFIVPYTHVSGASGTFYEYFERFEIYGGRRSEDEFRSIVLSRFSAYSAVGAIFECAFFQNIIEELMLFLCYDERRIIDFYRELAASIDTDAFLLLRLVPESLEASVAHVKKERVNDAGEEIWFSAMLSYLAQSPYGKNRGYSRFEDVLEHFRRRTALERAVLDALPELRHIELTSKGYELERILALIAG